MTMDDLQWKILLKWMIPIFGHLQICKYGTKPWNMFVFASTLLMPATSRSQRSGVVAFNLENCEQPRTWRVQHYSPFDMHNRMRLAWYTHIRGLSFHHGEFDIKHLRISNDGGISVYHYVNTSWTQVLVFCGTQPPSLGLGPKKGCLPCTVDMILDWKYLGSSHLIIYIISHGLLIRGWHFLFHSTVLRTFQI